MFAALQLHPSIQKRSISAADKSKVGWFDKILNKNCEAHVNMSSSAMRLFVIIASICMMVHHTSAFAPLKSSAFSGIQSFERTMELQAGIFDNIANLFNPDPKSMELEESKRLFSIPVQ